MYLAYKIKIHSVLNVLVCEQSIIDQSGDIQLLNEMDTFHISEICPLETSRSAKLLVTSAETFHICEFHQLETSQYPILFVSLGDIFYGGYY